MPWPLVGALVLWVLGAVLLPGLDPEPRGDWVGSRRFRGTYERPWCPVCRVVEEQVTTSPWVNQIAGGVQLIALASVVAAAMSPLRRARVRLPESEGLRRRRDEIEQERIERALAAPRRGHPGTRVPGAEPHQPGR